jgi:tetratricopeptide (TPR) repeat protein
LLSVGLQAQIITIDSLHNELQNHKAKDTIRVNLLNDIAYHSYRKQKAKAFEYLVEAESITKAIDFEKGQANSLYVRGLIQSDQSNYWQAIKLFNTALLVYEKLGFEKGTSNCYANIGLAHYNNFDFNKSITYYKKSIAIDKKIGQTSVTAINLKYLGFCYYDLASYDMAEEYLNYALDLNKKYNNRLEMSSCLKNLGNIYSRKGNYPLSLEYYNKSLSIYKTMKDTAGIATIFNNTGIIYKNYKNYDKAIENYQESLKIDMKRGNKKNTAVTLNNIGVVYKDKKDFKNALIFFNDALKMSKAIKDKDNIARCLINIGDVYLGFKNNTVAIQNFLEAKEINIEIGTQLGLCYSYLGIATVYKNEKEYDKALINAIESKKISNKIGVIDYQRDVYRLLSTIYENTNNYKKAFESHQQFKIFNDSLFNKENIEKIAQLENEYKFKRALDSASIRELKLTKEVSTVNTNLEKSQRNIFLTIIALLLTALILGGIIFFLKWRNIKEKNQNILIEQKLLRSQMTPHFIFNSLSVLQGMILNKEEKKSITYLSKFSKLLRIVLENSRDKIVPLIQELNAIDNYMVLQNLDTDLPYEYSLVVDENIDINLFQIPPMLIQPFIENAIEHAFDGQKEHREIEIHLKFEDTKLTCTIADNGMGIDAIAQGPNMKKKSLATTITSERLLMLAKEFKVHGGITIADRKKDNARGTLVILTIPYKINQNL